MFLSRLTDLSSAFCSDSSQEKQVMPGLSVFCRQAPSAIEASIYEPALCLILRGSKVVSIGDQSVELRPGDALVISHDLPVVSRITQASAQVPYLAVVLFLDLQLMHGLCDQVAGAPVSDASVRSLAIGSPEAAWVAPLLRYVELSASQLDAQVLGPSTLREIHYRLLLSPTGGMLRNLLAVDGHASRIARAIGLLRSEYRTPLKVSDLAKAAGMSASSFHEHFKEVTGTTPLQYQKDLRLIEAQTLLKALSHSVSEAAYAVGYESPNQFSRDYSKKFGVPPSKVARLVALS
jgi:AraC-like DNA-binding protein